MVHFFLMASLKFKPRGQFFLAEDELRGEAEAAKMGEVLTKGVAIRSLLLCE